MSKIISKPIDFSTYDYTLIPTGGYLLGYDLSNSDKLSKMDNSGNIIVLEGASIDTSVLDVGTFSADKASIDNLIFPTGAQTGYILNTNDSGVASWQPNDATKLIGSVVLSTALTGDQYFYLDGGNKFIITEIILYNSTTSLDSYDIITGTQTGTFSVAEMAEGDTSGNGRVIENLSNGNVAITTNTNLTPFVLGEIVTGYRSGATLIVGGVTHITNCIESFEIWTDVSRTGTRMANANRLTNLYDNNRYVSTHLLNSGGELVLDPDQMFFTSGPDLYASFATASGTGSISMKVYGHVIG